MSTDEPGVILEAPEEVSQARPETPSAPATVQDAAKEQETSNSASPEQTEQSLEAPDPPAKPERSTEQINLSQNPLPEAKELPTPPPDAHSDVHSEPTHPQNAPFPDNPSRNDVQPAPMQRSESQATILGGRDSTASAFTRPLLSGVLMQSALEQILSSKESKKSADLRKAVEEALNGLKNHPNKMHSRALLHPLKLACDTQSNPLRILALDCIGKLVTFSANATTNLDAPASPVPGSSNSSSGPKPDPELANEIVDLICDCFIESPTPNSSNSGPEAVNLHILSALLSLILSPNPALPVHQSALLKAVRTIYNIFLLSRGQQNQAVAQGALGQIVTAVFSRVSTDPPPFATPNVAHDRPDSEPPTAKPENGETQQQQQQQQAATELTGEHDTSTQKEKEPEQEGEDHAENAEEKGLEVPATASDGQPSAAVTLWVWFQTDELG